jgi:omega-6 fatty acid desaturase (delta-12 desaturase)
VTAAFGSDHDGAEAERIRRILSPYRTRRSVWATAIFLFDDVVFLVLITAAIAIRPAVPRFLVALAAGFQILRLASIAHDAGHQNYTGIRRLDKWIGRVAFLPALQPLGTWEIAHNVIHHSWTSIRGKDYVWIPRTKEEFDRIPRIQQWLERLYRSPWGHGIYYLVDLWLLRVFLPSFQWNVIRRRSHRLDIVLVGMFAAAWGSTAAVAAHGLGRDRAAAILFAEIIPFLTWCELFGLTLYLQHTHPSSRFFRDRAEWEFFSSLAASSIHVEFPRFAERLFHGIFEHTAHHLDPTIPFYELHDAQRALYDVLKGNHVVYRWSWREFLHCCRACKLYDYDRHLWLDFKGNVTS